MKKTKYILCWGLAFSEERDMKRLGNYAKDGWFLEKLTPFGYRLKRGKPQQIEYSLDYQNNPDQEYFLFFKETGWFHVCSIGEEIHIFQAPSGTKPIYSDQSTKIEKYAREQRQIAKVAFPALLLTLFCFFLKGSGLPSLVPKILGQISSVLIIPSFIALVFSGLPCLAYTFKIRKLKKDSI
ncbi:DUF2812 domain-containing protein [Cytobacillus sp. FJAT-54145]|uniref:DUF2812 domain-containing protein n=1 Tax=Cytobacillus spartinae TaxID=3299023 RepID=A0ABW6K9X0_9BACI